MSGSETLWRELVLGTPGVKPPVLPPVLDEVRPPTLLSPSRFADLLRCPLSVIHGLREEELLPPHPLAVLGGIIHDVMHAVRSRALGSQEEIENVVAEVFEERLGAVETRLAAEPSTRRLVSIRRAVGRTAWHHRKTRLHAWASTLSDLSTNRISSEGARSSSRDKRDEREGDSATIQVSTGSERPMRLPDSRLSGRPDRVERDSDGILHITDLKTGSVRDKEGQPLRYYALQVRLYGLMVERIDSDARVRLWLEGSERVEVPWDDAVRSETEELLDTALSDLPDDLSLPADSLAREGPQCGRCRIRHRCPRYRSVAPTWWRTTSTTKPVASFDAWGTLLEVSTKDERSYEVLLRDAADRKVRISGLEAGLGIGNLRDGDRIWFFDLEPSETLPRHGVFVHPRNFHGERPSPAWYDALRLQVFSEPARST